MQQLNADRLMRDLCAVVADVDDLVRATAGNASKAILDARGRIENSLLTANENLENARQCATDEATSVAQSAGAYLRKHIWKTVSIAGGLGFLWSNCESQERTISTVSRLMCIRGFHNE